MVGSVIVAVQGLHLERLARRALQGQPAPGWAGLSHRLRGTLHVSPIIGSGVSQNLRERGSGERTNLCILPQHWASNLDKVRHCLGDPGHTEQWAQTAEQPTYELKQFSCTLCSATEVL
jgi:hypothetical protein